MSFDCIASWPILSVAVNVGRAALHAQPLRVVGDGLAGGVEDRVVVAAAQLERHLAGDDRRHPALQRVAQHQRLGVEPAALVEQPAELAPALGVLRQRRLVVDRGQQPLVGDVQQRHAGCLVDAAALRLDDPVLDLVGHPEPVPAADLVRGADQRHRIGDRDVVDRDRQPVLEAHDHHLGNHFHGRVPVRDTHDRVDDLHARREQLEVLRLVRGAEQVRVGRVRHLDGGVLRQAASLEPLAHLLAAAELRDEGAVEPRLVDPQVLVREQPVAIEALDVVAFVRRAVAPDLDAVLPHLVDEHRPGDRPSERRRVEVAPARGLDVEGAALERGEALACERVAAVEEDGFLRAVEHRLRGNGGDVRLVVLAEVGGEGVRDRAVLAHPGERAARCRGRRRRRSRPSPRSGASRG